MQIDGNTVDFVLDDRMITVVRVDDGISITMQYRLPVDQDPQTEPDYGRMVHDDGELIAALCEAADW